MSAPPKYKPATWMPERLAQAMAARGIDDLGLRSALNRSRLARGHDIPIHMNTIRAWLSGSSSPMSGRTGFQCQVFEIADALDVSLDWLLGRVDDEPRAARKRAGRGGS